MTDRTPEYVNTTELAEILGVTRHMINYWMRHDLLPRGRRAGAKRIHHLPTVLDTCSKNCLKIDPLAYELMGRRALEREFQEGILQGLEASKHTD